MSISVLILTYNEAVNIADCLRSVDWSGDVVVLDSVSTDKTVEIACGMGARVVHRPFDNYAAQRNFGLNQISYRNPWVLMLDADERVTPDLRDELLATTAGAPVKVCMYRFRRHDHLFGRWIRRSSGYPTWFGRVARLGAVRVERSVNEEYKTDGEIATLRGHVDHFPFNKGFHDWILKHDRYSTMEAQLMAAGGERTWRRRDLLGTDPMRRRAALKAMIYATPFRPALVFMALYIFRGGLFEGCAGLSFSLLRAWYEFMINCKYREIRRRDQGLPV